MGMQGLDNYIMGVNIHCNDEIWHQCLHCQAAKRIPMFYELGGWFYQNDDACFCEYCQADSMEIVY